MAIEFFFFLILRMALIFTGNFMTLKSIVILIGLLSAGCK